MKLLIALFSLVSLVDSCWSNSPTSIVLDLNKVDMLDSYSCYLNLATRYSLDSDYVFIIPNQIRDGTDVAIPAHFPLDRDYNILLTATLIDGVNATTEDANTLIESAARIHPQQHASTIILKVIPGTLRSGIYIIKILAVNEKTGVVTCKNETRVYATSQSSTTMIQTNKAVYKRGEIVKYRLFTIDAALNIRNPPLNVKIIDPNGKIIDEHIRVGIIMGFQDKLQLSDISPFGTWKIQTNKQQNASNIPEIVDFEVTEYMPENEVMVILPSFMTPADTSLIGTIKSVDKYGMPVKGTVIILVSRRYMDGIPDKTAFSVEIPINGDAHFDIPRYALMTLSQKRDHLVLLVQANVTDATTGITASGQALIPYYEHQHEIEFSPYMQETFKPNLNPFTVVVKVKNHYGQPPHLPTEEMKITVSYFSDKSTKENLRHGNAFVKNTTVHQLNEDGTVVMDITIPNITAVAAIKAVYGGQSVYKTIRRFNVGGSVYLKADMTSAGPLNVGADATVEVTITSLKSRETVYYIIVAKGLIIKTGEIVITSASMKGKVKFEITREMVPSARFIAYNLRTSDKKVVVDGLNFVIENMFENKVKIELDQRASVLKPISKINVRVTADAGSLINVLVEDKSALPLQNSNDITSSRVKDALRQFGDTPLFDSEWDHSVSRPIVADDSFHIFENAGLRFLTDMNIFKSGNGKSNNGQASRVNRIDSVMGIVETRNNFSKTLVWYSQIAPNGTITISETIPDTITKYVVSVYALNKETGLGMARVTSTGK